MRTRSFYYTLAVLAAATLACSSTTAQPWHGPGMPAGPSHGLAPGDIPPPGTGTAPSSTNSQNNDDPSASGAINSDASGGDVKAEAEAMAKEIRATLTKYSSVVFGAGIAVGLVFGFAGYQLFPATMFLTAGSIASVTTYLTLDNFLSDSYGAKAAIIISATILAGLILGIMGVFLRKVGIFAAGVAGGVAGAFTLNASILCHLPLLWEHAPAHLYLYAAAALFGLAGGILAFKLQAPIIISATSLGGALAVVAGTKYFVDGAHQLTLNTYDEKVTWAYIAACAVLAAAGFAVQWRRYRRKRAEADASGADLESGRPVVRAAQKSSDKTGKRRASLLLNQVAGAANMERPGVVVAEAAVYMVPPEDGHTGGPQVTVTPSAPLGSGTYMKV